MVQPSVGPKPPTVYSQLRAAGVLHYYLRTLVFVTIYLTLVIVPWVATCVLNVWVAPGSHIPYDSNTGQIINGDLDYVAKWLRATPILNIVAALMALPVATAVLEHVAVVQAHRVRADQALSARRLFVLADIPWPQLSARGSSFWDWLVAIFLLLGGYYHLQRCRRVLCSRERGRGF